ncbi:hypothetical protein Q3V23_23395 [Streptomyces sp. VNUA116]|uniref:hypothetical protein n=1 Tax=Streptomyces sp. VNUA116 TaxID=3062449 RepID=UPI00267448A4|nr:hypothetical protein [Streptomyces sp. VNUA116]WKU46767.1 hypothetical protein Q3V23_23395 [Streptomyces sp. VNUA116]
MQWLRDAVISEDFKADRDVITADMQYAVTLDFGAYVAYLGHYGDKLRRLAAAHSNPEAAFIHLRSHADKALELANR